MKVDIDEYLDAMEVWDCNYMDSGMRDHIKGLIVGYTVFLDMPDIKKPKSFKEKLEGMQKTQTQ